MVSSLYFNSEIWLYDHSVFYMHICNLRMWYFMPLYIMQTHSVNDNLMNDTSGTHKGLPKDMC